VDEALAGLDPEPRDYRFYASQNILGELYRDIDERQFLHKMQQQQQEAAGAPPSLLQSRLLTKLLKYLERWVKQYGIMYKHHISFARDVRDTYEDSLQDIMHCYGPSAHAPLSENEVFAGQILGRQGGAQGKPLRELSKTMRERFEQVAEYAVVRMIKGDQAVQEAIQMVGDIDDLYDDVYSDREFEALPRAMACLRVAAEEPGLVDRQCGELKSFGYVAAGVCLRELQRYRITTFGSYVLPRIS
jgi:hypothetical protein